MNSKALYNLSYGLYLVSSKKGDNQNNAQVANTVFQVTSEPATIAISINKGNFTWECIKESGIFAVSVLQQDTPLAFIGNFGFKSGRDIDKLVGINFKIGQTGAPIITDNANAYFEASLTKELDAGTHTLFIGKLEDADVLNNKPGMTYAYYHEVKRGTTPRSAPHYIKEG